VLCGQSSRIAPNPAAGPANTSRGGNDVRAEEGYIEVPGGRVWFRSIGEAADDRAPLLCLHGGPGFTHNYLEPLEALADRRRVIFYDQLGCGRSERPDDLSLWTVQRFVEEVAQVRAALGLERLHLFGSSWAEQPGEFSAIINSFFDRTDHGSPV
jgi:pimeloyl-ACP methyl ester carboxylesterase